jgi:hypothetical protein
VIAGGLAVGDQVILDPMASASAPSFSGPFGGLR